MTDSTNTGPVFDFVSLPGASLPGWRFLGGPVPDDSALARNPGEVSAAVVAMLRAIGLPLDTPVAIGPTSSAPSEKDS